LGWNVTRFFSSDSPICYQRHKLFNVHILDYKLSCISDIQVSICAWIYKVLVREGKIWVGKERYWVYIKSKFSNWGTKTLCNVSLRETNQSQESSLN
jgi:hypothetical protein